MANGDPARSSIGIGGVVGRLALAPWAPLLIIAFIGTLPFAAGDLLNVAAQTIERSLFVGLWLSLFAVLLGTPLYLIYRRLGWAAWWAYTAGAAALVDAVMAALVITVRNDDFSYYDNGCDAVIHNVVTACGRVELLQSLAAGGLLGAAFGAACGFTFWVLTKLPMRSRRVGTDGPAG